MDFTGCSLRGFVYAESDGFADEADLQAWLARCVRFADLAGADAQGRPLLHRAVVGADGTWHSFLPEP